MKSSYLFDVAPYNNSVRRYGVRPVRLSRHPGIERALLRLKHTIESLPPEPMRRARPERET